MDSSKIWITPSVLSADIGRLEQEVLNLEKAGADGLHIDVMDGHFVPQITFGALLVKKLKQISRLPLDVHLMVQNPENQIPHFISAGAKSLSFHIEATSRPLELLKNIKSHGVQAGLALKPQTACDNIYPFLKHLDFILVMTVEPGKSGQTMIEAAAGKITRIQKELKKIGHKACIQVDGGVSLQTVPQVSAADIFVSGHYILKHQDYDQAISTLRKEVEKHKKKGLSVSQSS